MNREITYDNVQYGTLVEIIYPEGGYHAGMKVHFFNQKGVLIGNLYEFLPYSRLRLREPYPIDTRNPRPYDGLNRDYPKYFMDERFESIKDWLFQRFCKFITILIKFSQSKMHKN